MRARLAHSQGASRACGSGPRGRAARRARVVVGGSAKAHTASSVESGSGQACSRRCSASARMSRGSSSRRAARLVVREVVQLVRVVREVEEVRALAQHAARARSPEPHDFFLTTPSAASAARRGTLSARPRAVAYRACSPSRAGPRRAREAAPSRSSLSSAASSVPVAIAELRASDRFTPPPAAPPIFRRVSTGRARRRGRRRPVLT